MPITIPKDRHIMIFGVLAILILASGASFADTTATPVNPGHPLSQTWIDTNLNMSSYNIYTTTGSVGIGINPPTQRLDVSGKIRISNDATAPSAGTIRYLAGNFEGYNGSSWNAFTGGGGAGSQNLLQVLQAGSDASLYAGITRMSGVTINSGRAISATSAANDAVMGQTTGGTGAAIYGWSTGPNAYAGYFEGGKGVKIGSSSDFNATGNAYLASVSGNVGIGANPSYKLDVAGDVNIGSSNVYRRGGTAGASVSGCLAGQFLQNPAVSGGIVTGGNCASALTSEADPEVGALTNGQWCTSNGAQVICNTNAPVTGSGTQNNLTKWTGSGAVGSSVIYEIGASIGIGTASPQEKLDVAGAIKIGDTSSICDAAHRGAIKAVLAPAGECDSILACVKNSNDGYDWVEIKSCSGWLSGCPGIKVATQDLTTQQSWKVSMTACDTPQCSQDGAQDGDGLVSSNAIDFSLYPARDACKSIGGRLPTRSELSCIANNQGLFGTFKSDNYWTNAEQADAIAYARNMQPFGGGFEIGIVKTTAAYVRCVK